MYLGEEMKIKVPKPLIIFTDSSGAIGYARNNGGAGKMKHIDIRSAWVQQLRNAGEIELQHVPGTENKADFFTKILPRPATMAAVDCMMGDMESSTIKADDTAQGSVFDGGMCRGHQPVVETGGEGREHGDGDQSAELDMAE